MSAYREDDGARAEIPDDHRWAVSSLANAEEGAVRAERDAGYGLGRAEVALLLSRGRVKDDRDASCRIGNLAGSRIGAERSIVGAVTPKTRSSRLLYRVRRHLYGATERIRGRQARWKSRDSKKKKKEGSKTLKHLFKIKAPVASLMILQIANEKMYHCTAD